MGFLIVLGLLAACAAPAAPRIRIMLCKQEVKEMEQKEHPKGALALTVIYIVIVAVIWFSIYAILLARG